MRAIALSTLVLLSACSVIKEPEPSASADAQPSAPSPDAGASLPAPPQIAARSVSEETELFEFAYAYPAAAAAIPALKSMLDSDLDKTRKDLIADSGKAKTDAASNGYPYNAYIHSVDWQVVTDLPAWLSMSGTVGVYSGGAHPNQVFDTILWDKIANTRRAPLDLFVSKAALASAIRAPFCKELDRQRATKRQNQVKGGGIAEFEQCIDPSEQVIILGSSNGKAFDRIGMLVAPYNAGPYSEGSYEVTVPVTPQVMETVKPAFKATFVTG